MKISDARLIKRSRKGDADAFAQLVRRYQRTLFDFLVRSIRDRDFAEDLFQETWIKVYQALPAYREEGKFKAWLLGIANHLVLDAWRHHRLRRMYEIHNAEMANAGADGRALPDQVMEERDLLERIAIALERLPPKQRQVFLLRQKGELTFKEIAEEMGEPLNTVIGHMHYAMTKLRHVFHFSQKVPENESRE